jgi:ClpX C4-type zinc finger
MPKQKSDAPLMCSFCGKRDGDAPKLVAGPNRIAICTECVHLAAEIVADAPPAPSRLQEVTLVLEDESRHLVATGLHEAVSILGTDDSRIVAFHLIGGARIAVRRQTVRLIQAAPEPDAESSPRPDWVSQNK